MIEVSDLAYAYGPQHPKLFRSLNYRFDASQVHVIRGPNGVGKSTLLRILATLVRPTDGEVKFNGESSAKAIAGHVRNRIAFSAGAPLGFYPRLNAYDNLTFFASIKGISLSPDQIDELGERVGLGLAALAKKFHEYSLGMRQRLHLARLLLPTNDFFLVDEITNGLDVDGVELCRRLLTEELVGKTRILVSHDAHFVKSLDPKILELKLS
ncbi:MAG TPA: ABC transporter ATP-binding protein [Bdellovibrionota bacterium]|jgi:ABC-2 type transport system ATP-binding protein|nr:ABC transporter ATP-binding protein [Bdellovibrionota bacterium]